MDKQASVGLLDKLVDGLRHFDIDVTGYRVMPAYYGYREFPLRVGIVVPTWTKEISLKAKIDKIVEALHSGILTREERTYISSVLPFDSLDELNADFDEREGVSRPVVEPYWPD